MGSIICKIQEAAIDFPVWSVKLSEIDSKNGSGAIVWFIGNVRKINLVSSSKVNAGEYQEVNGITYECYEVLAEKILNEIGLEAQERFDKKLSLLVIHRIGYLRVGECSILIGVSSLHRGPAYEASRYIIEEIKKRVPIWKLEHYSSGQSQWLKGQSLNKIFSGTLS